MNDNLFGTQFLNTQPALLERLKSAIVKMFDSHGTIYAQNEQMTVKLYQDKDECIGFILFKEGENYSLYYNNYSAFTAEGKKLINACALSHTCPEEVLSYGRIYEPKVIKFCNDVIDSDSSDLKFKEKEEVFIAFSPYIIVKTFNYLEKIGIEKALNSVEKQELKNLSATSMGSLKVKLSSLQQKMDAILVSSKNNKFNCIKNAFKFNDGDNYVWVREGNLYLKDQNNLFIYVPQDADNFKVYYIDVEYASNKKCITNWKKEVKAGTFDEFKIAIDKKDGVVASAFLNCLNSWDIDVEDSYNELDNAGLIKEAEDINQKFTYDYVRKFYATQKNRSEQEMIFQAFYMESYVWIYNEKYKTLYPKNIFYSKEIDESECVVVNDDPQHAIYDFSTGNVIFGELNSQWIAGLLV